MRDILTCDKPFGGKVVFFGGDFRQILPVITDGGRVEIVLTSLNSSFLWASCKVLRLIKGSDDRGSLELVPFSKWVMDIGDGKINKIHSGETKIDILGDLLISDCVDPIQEIIKEDYGEAFATKIDHKFSQGRAILSLTN